MFARGPFKVAIMGFRFIDLGLFPLVAQAAARRIAFMNAAQAVVEQSGFPEWKISETAVAIESTYEAAIFRGDSVRDAWDGAVSV